MIPHYKCGLEYLYFRVNTSSSAVSPSIVIEHFILLFGVKIAWLNSFLYCFKDTPQKEARFHNHFGICDGFAIAFDICIYNHVFLSPSDNQWSC